MTLKDAMFELNLVQSFAEVRRMCEEGFVRINDVVASDPETTVKVGDVIRRGKHIIRMVGETK